MTALSRRPTAVLLTALAIGALAACGGPSSNEGAANDGAAASAAATGPADAQTVTIDSTDQERYRPAIVTAEVGTLTLTLGNSGQSSHNLVFDDASLPKIGTVTGGKQLSATYTFTAAGSYDFVCTFHGGMAGKVVVS